MEIENFLHSIHGLVEGVDAAKQLYKEQFSPDFTVFDFIRDDETRLSSVLSFLLDPKGKHGQGTKFLNAFVGELDLPLAWTNEIAITATVKTEVPTQDRPRRIDIIVGSGRRALAIENKPWARDTKDQVHDYLYDLEQRFIDGFCLLYLSGGGEGPSDISICAEEMRSRVEKKELCVRGYSTLIPWLEECRSLSKSSRVSNFIVDFTVHQCNFFWNS